MILNLHERWLLRTLGVGRAERQSLFGALAEQALPAGDVDLLAEAGGYTLGKRSVRKDLESLFDRLLSPYAVATHGVAYGNRRYRRDVILVAALHQAGVDASEYRTGAAAGYCSLSQFKELVGAKPS
ncbi:hypothetical protein ACSMXN_21100 [Jatrophihabitans sp. DSM 45814]